MCNFCDPNLVTSYYFILCIYLMLNEEHFTFHLQYKHSGTFANRKYEELPYPKIPKMCNPILVTLLKMRPHYSQSSHENATPSSSTSPLASYKEVPPPRDFYHINRKTEVFVICARHCTFLMDNSKCTWFFSTGSSTSYRGPLHYRSPHPPTRRPTYKVYWQI